MDTIYMQRCLQLAALGCGTTAPNPMVGAVLVYEGMIIGEGYHALYGGPHAEVNCINSVKGDHKELIDKSTLYVSLEPCNHTGKTPPCTHLILHHKIPRVVVACTDKNELVNGRGIESLQNAGVKVITGVLEKEAMYLNRRFFTFHEKKRPYIILKWAQSLNKKIAPAGKKRLLISNELTNRMVHKWRSEEAAIMIGTKTAINDNPALTNRLWKGNNPTRIVIDKKLVVPVTHQLMDGSVPTIIFNLSKEINSHKNKYCKLDHPQGLLEQVLSRLYTMKFQSLLVEGGAVLLQSFIDAGCWDEARVITNTQLIVEERGQPAPIFENRLPVSTDVYYSDRIEYYQQRS